jgi:CheY-like chemotaxis protein
MGRILVVEDDTALRRVYQAWLGRLGHTVTLAASGLEGLRLAVTEGAPDLIVSDLLMPGSDGDELVAAAAGLAPELPIVVVTGCGDRHRLRAIENQPNVRAVLAKPVDHATFVRALEAALAGPADEAPPTGDEAPETTP